VPLLEATMPRPAALSPDQIRTIVLTMLAEAEVSSDHPPPTPERFRRVVSVRKLRARLGAGEFCSTIALRA
jgi:hypothetical protein